jgi:hypothetical protein
MHTLRATSKLVSMSPAAILRFIESGDVKPKRLDAPYIKAGFVYQFSDKDIAKLKTLKRPTGRPRKDTP